MKQIVNIEVHFSVIGFCNCYILSALPETDESPGRKPAIVIDPGIFDESLLTLIEGNRYDVKQVLVTHNHEAHVRGLKTLKKIYDAEIYARASLVEGFRTQVLRGGDELVLSGIPLSVIEIPGHSEDSLVFRVEDALFTGDTIGAGRVGSTKGIAERSLLIGKLNERIFSIPGNPFIFPGHGPLSTLEAERRFNADILLS